MTKSYALTVAEMDTLFEALSEKYAIYAPTRLHNGGRYALDDTILYKEVTKYEEIEWKQRSIFSMKEVLTPLSQTLFYFTEEDSKEAKLKDERELLIFGRACDLNSVKIQDQIFLENGGEQDYFYKRLREKAHFAVMQCDDQYDGCFCCSLGTNVTDIHDFGVAFSEVGAKIQLNSELFEGYFSDAQETLFEVSFPQENQLKVAFPQIESQEEYQRLRVHPMWEEYDKRCIACGKCTIACNTCTCFTTTDIFYSENQNVGERRRGCASCMIAGFDTMAGDHCFRKTVKDRYRFKILHKVYGHDARFHTGAMCTGCGRCDADCPELISYSQTLANINAALIEIRQEIKEGVPFHV